MRYPKTILVTHTFDKRQPPALVLPLSLPRAFKTDEEFALKVEKFVQVREEEMDGILINIIPLRKGV